ncbi:succinylglutamate desuccinylase/aspartoacylase family protein [Ideonella sp. 4Y16]|uniref:Succinylglutamate desuccinylase/aspartoacylase family protein n=1 Tax=Ideonella alba TaxID=2824118 RepID=A0A940YA94_9BURK|nr:succinylglutamate desuccinylase/aspartoacylase family protein [Ideonella alba]MBQ0929276.1 succinylglutamate desuccinylase/aspartoacylase family protein [Ideonella alba]MBQ0945387.1 succinylglutamate desuccinylase/aspartoacylase family protein [Ideonella alba]
MRTQHHTLLAATPGTRHELVSLHYGTPGGRKVYIQGALHADEVPGLLVAHHLRGLLATAEAEGRLLGEVVLVPAANPLGLRQWHLRGYQGRFEFTSGENFNRHFADLSEPALARVQDRLGPDAATNVALVRAALREAAAELSATTPLEDLRRLLLGLAIDAELVLDLHSDGEGLLHIYTTPATWDQAELLVRCIDARVALIAERSGGDPFDEACSMVWPQIAARLPAGTPLPPSCLAATIELRGEGDVRHELAAQDAAGILRLLVARGIVRDDAAADIPPLRCQPTPLAGSIPLVAPHGGMVVFLKEPGAEVVEGEPIVDVIDPITGQVSTLGAGTTGLFFARENRRFAVAGMALGKVAGVDARRSGSLLSV